MNNECAEDYEVFLECLDAQSCDDFFLWIEQDPIAPCRQEEQHLAETCPEVNVYYGDNG